MADAAIAFEDSVLAAQRSRATEDGGGQRRLADAAARVVATAVSGVAAAVGRRWRRDKE